MYLRAQLNCRFLLRSKILVFHFKLLHDCAYLLGVLLKDLFLLDNHLVHLLVFFLGRTELILALAEDPFQVWVFFLLFLQTHSELNLCVVLWVSRFFLHKRLRKNTAIAVPHVKFWLAWKSIISSFAKKPEIVLLAIRLVRLMGFILSRNIWQHVNTRRLLAWVLLASWLRLALLYFVNCWFYCQDLALYKVLIVGRRVNSRCCKLFARRRHLNFLVLFN